MIVEDLVKYLNGLDQKMKVIGYDSKYDTYFKINKIGEKIRVGLVDQYYQLEDIDIVNDVSLIIY